MLGFRRHPARRDYLISECGMVISLKRHKAAALTKSISYCGYVQYKVDNQWRNFHRLLMETFNPTTQEGLQVNHKDGDKLNNCLSNLEWCTQRDNLHHAMDNKLHNWGRGGVVSNKDGAGHYYPSQADAARAGYLQPLINKCVKGLRKTHAGFTWREI